jgi:hypothetical protein
LIVLEESDANDTGTRKEEKNKKVGNTSKRFNQTTQIRKRVVVLV